MPILLHLADLHIGAPYENVPPAVSTACRDAQFAALMHAVEHANDLGAAAILIPGDLFDAPSTPLPLFGQTMDILSRARCPVLIAPGNHDYLHPASPYCTAPLPPNIHIFSSTKLEPFAIDDSTIVWGAAFCDMSARISLDAPLEAGKCNLLCLHADLEGDSSYNPLRPADIAVSGFVYAAFGHNHTCSGLRHAGCTVYACPGCFVGRGPHESGPRGYLCGSIQADSVDLRLVPSGGMQFETIRQDLTGVQDDRALGRAVASRIPTDYERTCLTLELTGERSYEPDLSGLQKALARVCVYAALHDRTTVAQDPWRYRDSDDLRGEVTRRAREAYDACEEKSGRAQHLLALRIALASLEGSDFPG